MLHHLLLQRHGIMKIDTLKIVGTAMAILSTVLVFAAGAHSILSPMRGPARAERQAPQVQPARVVRPQLTEPVKNVTVEENKDPLFGWDVEHKPQYQPSPPQASINSMSLLPPIEGESEIFGLFGVDKGFLERRLPGPLKQYAGSFIKHGQKYGVHPCFLAAIAKHETGNGTSSAFRNKNNAMGVSNTSGPRYMKSVDYSIEYMAKRLADPNGYYKNCNTIAEIGDVYAPSKVRVKNDPTGLNRYWPSKVSSYFNQLTT
jgi:hypothetical protein